MALPKDAKFYSVYALLCPIEGQVKYIGVSMNLKNRYTCHCCDYGGASPTDKQLWIRSLRANGVKPSLWELERVTTYPEAVHAESWWKFAARQNGIDLIDGQGIGSGYWSFDWKPTQAEYDRHLRYTKQTLAQIHNRRDWLINT